MTPEDALAPLVRERLTAPSLSPFTEHPLAQAPAPTTPWQTVEAKTLKYPRDFYPVRIERSGDTVVLLALSHRTDPVGEVSGGAYWLLLSQGTRASDKAQLFTAFFAQLKGKATPPPLDADFLALDRDLLSGTRRSSRLLVLTPEELEQAQKRFGSFYPMELEVFFDADADRALLIWSERWRGGQYLCQKKAGRWVFTSLSSWVT